MGRPRLPEGERMEAVSIRLPTHVVKFFRERAASPTTAMRRVLEKFVDRVNGS